MARRFMSPAKAAPEGGGTAGATRGRRAKRRKQAEPPSDEEEDAEEEQASKEDGDDAGGDDEGDDLDVDFEFFDPTEEDYHSVGDFIKSGTWAFVDLNFAELADSITGQGNIGTLIKSDAGDEDTTLCALLTTLNLRQFRHLSWPAAIREALTAKATKHAPPEVLQKAKALLEEAAGQEVGLLISERFVNLPPQLVAPLHRALQEDIEWSCNTPECPPDERPFYGFTHFVGIARCFEASSSSTDGATASAPPSKKRRKGAQAAREDAAAEPQGAAPAPGELIFQHPEDAAYVKRAAFSFTFPMPSEAAEKRVRGKGARGKELRVVFGIARKAFEQVVRDLEAAPPLEAMASGAEARASSA